MAGLAYDVGTRESNSAVTIVAKTPVVTETPVVAETPVVTETPVVAETPVATEAPVERGPLALETRAEPKPRMQLAALDPNVRLLDESDQPTSKGYIMYSNSPAVWTPVPLPDEISAVQTPHTNNIRAEIEQAATLFDVDVQMMKAFAKIESGYNPKAKTGSRPANTSACSSFPTGSLPNTGRATSTTFATARSRRPESLRLRLRSSRRTSVVRRRRQKSIASTSKGIKAVRFITTRRTSWHGRTCT